MKLSLDDLFNRSTPEPNSGCWIWMRAVNKDGYAIVSGRPWSGHKHAWQIVNGPVPGGFELDHSCDVRCCVNPDHIRPLSHADNVRRAKHPYHRNRNGRKTHCVRGHALGGDNLIIEPSGTKRGFARKCAECRRAAKRRRYHQRKENK